MTDPSSSDAAQSAGKTDAVEYEPLDPARSEIRLVTILPCDDGDGGLRCVLTKHSLDNNPVFFALSYVWGDAGTTTPIIVNGRTFNATINLAEALRNLSGYGFSNARIWSHILSVTSDPVTTFGDLLTLTANLVKALRRFADRGADSVRLWFDTVGITEVTTPLDAFRLLVLHGLPPLLLWVDAICINQEDVPERNHQVALMSRIYSQSKTTLIWIGDKDATSWPAIALARWMSARIKSSRDRRSFAWLADPTFETLLDDFSPRDPFEAVLDLFARRPYWSRTWTLQEMTLASSSLIICGGDTCYLQEAIVSLAMWPMFVRIDDLPPGLSDRVWSFVCKLVEQARGSTSPLSKVALLALSVGGLPEFKLDAISALRLTRHSRATDPRDKLYSLSNLVDLGLDVDYSVSYETLCRTFAVAHISGGRDAAAILANAGTLIGLPRSLPSWVPDWDFLSKSAYADLMLPQKWTRLTRANRGSNVSTDAVRVAGDILTAAGARFDVIEATLHGDGNSDGYLVRVVEFLFGSNIRAVLADVIPDRPRNRLYRTGIPLTLAVLRTLVADRDIFGSIYVPEPIDVRKDSFERLAAAFLFLIGREQLQAESRGESSYTGCRPRGAKDIFSPERDFYCRYSDILQLPSIQNIRADPRKENVRRLEGMTAFLRGAKPFRTRDGYFGYASSEVREGDLVCVLAASTVPVVLRAVGERYLLVSLCFVIGCMDGEAWTMVESGQLRVVEFNIC